MTVYYAVTCHIEGYSEKRQFFTIIGAIYSGTVCPTRLSFSQLGLLMSTPSPEKDSFLGPTVPMQIAPQILKNEGFYNPLSYLKCLC